MTLSSVAMTRDGATLSELLSGFRVADGALRKAMRHRASSAQRADHLLRSARLLEKLETYEPRTYEELRDQTFFFLMRAVGSGGLDRDGVDLERALALLARAGPAFSDTGAGADADPHQIATSAERVSLIATDYRYVGTSLSNAEFYARPQDQVVGRHVGEIIGDARFENRARTHFETCFKGEAREYYHGLRSPAGDRIMRCQMKPARDTGGGRAALVYMRDVTDDLPKMLAATDI